MELLLLLVGLGALLGLGLAALRWGVDSADGNDWSLHR